MTEEPDINKLTMHTLQNPKLSLQLIKSPNNKSFEIVKIKSGESLGSIPVRDYSKIAGTDWDTRRGRFLSITFVDGSIRIHDVFKGVKLTALLRTGLAGVDCTLWDQVETVRSVGSPHVYSFGAGTNILDVMPELTKFSGDIVYMHVERYILLNEKWRRWDDDDDQDSGERVLDLRLLRSLTSDELMCVLNGDYTLTPKISNEQTQTSYSYNYCGVPMCRIQKGGNQGQYLCYYKNGGIKKIDSTPFLMSPCSMETLDNIQTLKGVAKFFSHHLTLLTRDIFDRYNQFVHRVCEEAYGYERLYHELREMFLTGYISNDLSQWLRYTVGRKRMEDWAHLVHEAFHKTNELLTLAFIPACEKFLVLLERCQGLIMAMRILRYQSTTDKTSNYKLEDCLRESPELNALKANVQELLSLCVRVVKSTAIDNESSTTFMEWLTDCVERESDENFDIIPDYSNDATVALRIHKAIETFLSPDETLMAMGPERHDLFERAPFERLVNGISKQLDLIDTKYIKPELAGLIIVSSELLPPTAGAITVELLDVLRDIHEERTFYIGICHQQETEHERVSITVSTSPTGVISSTRTEAQVFQSDVTALLNLERFKRNHNDYSTEQTDYQWSLEAKVMRYDGVNGSTEGKGDIDVHNNGMTTTDDLETHAAVRYVANFTQQTVSGAMTGASRHVLSVSFAVMFDGTASNEIVGIRIL